MLSRITPLLCMAALAVVCMAATSSTPESAVQVTTDDADDRRYQGVGKGHPCAGDIIHEVRSFHSGTPSSSAPSAPSAVSTAVSRFTPPPGQPASPAAIAAVLAAVPPPAEGEIVVDFESAQIGTPVPKWEEKGVTFELVGPLKRTPAAKPRVMFFPHLATGRKGILNAMATDQAVPLRITLPADGATSVMLVLWGSTGCPAVVEAFDRDGGLVDRQSIASVPGRKSPEEPVPFAVVTLKGAMIASVHLSGPRNGEFLAADEVRFLPSGKNPE